MTIRLMVVCLCALVSGCGSTTYRRPRPDLPLSERGSSELRQLLDDFERAIATKDFGVAQEMLAELKDDVKQADSTIRMHWDFATIADGATRGSALLQEARRNHSATAVSDSIDRRIDEADRLLALMSENGPTTKGLKQITELIDQLRELREASKQHTHDEATAQRVGDTLLDLEKARLAYDWLLQLASRLDAALAVLRRTPSESDLPAQIKHGGLVVEALVTCQKVITEALRLRGHAEHLKITTPLGRFAVDETAEICASEKVQTEDTIEHLRWRYTVEDLALRVSDTLRDLERRKKADAVEGATTRAVEALQACAQRLENTDRVRGYDPSMSFATSMGPMTAVRLRDACVKVGGRLAGARPTLRWRTTVSSLHRDIEAVRKKSTSAKKASAGELADLERGFADCVKRAAALATRSDAAWRTATPSSSETGAMKSLAKMCGKERAYIQRLIKQKSK